MPKLVTTPVFGVVNFIYRKFTMTPTPTLTQANSFATHDDLTDGPVGALGRFAMPAPHVSGTAALSLQSLALTQDFGALAGVKKALVTVPVRKPNNQAYVRVHPGGAWRFQAAILQLKDDGECYLVVPMLYSELVDEVRPKILYAAISRDGSPFLWPVNAPGVDGRLDNWSESAHVAAQMAQTHWVRLIANRTVGAYDVMQATNLADEPQWPEKSFEEIVQIAFKGRIIESLDHPIIKRLRGEM